MVKKIDKPGKKEQVAADSPILNSPYDAPSHHYATTLEGELNYNDVRPGRRIFSPQTPQVPLGQQAQTSLYDLNDHAANYQSLLVNLLRDQVSLWRQSGYPDVTSRVTRDLLQFWFLNPERPNWKRLFFAQQEAVETAIWLNEVAHKSNVGTHVLDQLRLANESVEDPDSVLPRIAFKMATGTGKTVVMACLILYHYLNRSQYRNDPRYVDYFLLVAPGITIRDRLNVLRVDTHAQNDHEAQDYYRERQLVPAAYAGLLAGLNAKLSITNFHAFEPRLIGGNKRSPLDGKIGADGQKVQAREDVSQMLKRVLSHFKPGRRMAVINDEAHHCYLPRAKGKDTEEDNSAKTRLMTATYPWYKLADTAAGDIRHGFVYKTVPHVTLKSLANGEPPDTETLFDQPEVDKKKLRVAGPFTVETLQSFEPLAPDQLNAANADMDNVQRFTDRIFEHLKTAGIKNGDRNETAVFSRVDIINDAEGALHAEGWYDTAQGERKAYLVIGPQFGSVSKAAVNAAVKACSRRADADWLVILGFAFESDIDNRSVTRKIGSFEVTKARMHDDLMQEGLIKKDKKAASFVTIGEPDIGLIRSAGSVQIEIKGLDIYDPVKDEVKGRSVADISYWMLDDQYDGSNFMPSQIFFCGGDKDEFAKFKKGLQSLAVASTKKAAEQTLKIELDDEAFDRLYGFVSHPVPATKGRKLAVRVISQFGEESTKVMVL